MFTRKAQLVKRTGPDRTGRYEFLKQLIVEFTTTSIFESKKQTLANLANFSYDPVNFEYLKKLHTIDLFLAQLSEKQEDLLHFALAAICNLSPDPEIRDYIVGLNGIKLVSNQLLHRREEIALNAITTLYFLITPETKHLVTPEIEKKIDIYAASTKPCYSNLGRVFQETFINNV